MSKIEVSQGGARKRFEDLYDELRKRICLLYYLPNTRLREEVLAAEFGVSRTPLRRVLVRLESEGLLTAKHGVGTIVTDINIKELRQAYELRMELAELIGKLSPIAVDDIDLRIWESFSKRGQALIANPDLRDFSQLNMDFSHAVFNLTRSAPLREVSERLYYQTARIWIKSIPHMNLETESVVFCQEIDSILQALAVGDLSAVGHIRRSHISMSYTRLWRFECAEEPTDLAQPN
jgi:DNA-binding GntR family transcriptional regulator